MNEAQLVFERVPENFRSKLGRDVVTGDVFNIAARIADLSEDAYGSRDHLLLTDRVADGWPDDGGFRYVISELCVDGELRWVMGIQHGELDERVMTKLREMLTVPAEKRFSALEAEEARRTAQREIDELDKMTEEIGLPMLRDLEACGFIQRPPSYSKRGTFGPQRKAVLERKRVIVPGMND